MRPQGFYDGIPMDQYHAGDELSCSGLKELALSEAHYIASKKHRPHRNEIIGTLTHMCTLERPMFDSKVVVIEGHRGGKAVKEAVEAAELSGKIVCKPDEYAKVVAMSNAIMAHPHAKKLFRGGVAERSFFWIDPETKAPMRCRADYFIPEFGVVSDIKYFTDLTDFNLQSQIRRMKYDWQAAMYSDGIGIVTGKPIEVFANVFVEEPRFPNDEIGVRVVTIEEESLSYAREQYRPLIEKFQAARTTKKWASYPVEITSLRVPPRY